MGKSRNLSKSYTDSEIDSDVIDAKAGRKNLIINGGFDVWQRGTSFSSNGYTADRWAVTGSGTFSFAKHGEPNKVLVSMVSEGSFCNLLQAIETSDVVKLRGKQVTLSAYMTTNSIHSGQFSIGARYSNTTDTLTLQSTSVISEAKTVGTDTTRVSVTFTVPVDAVGLLLFIDNAVVQAAGSLYDVSEVQLELGSQATDFEYRSYGEELALCQRYYCEFSAGGLIGTAASSYYVHYYYPYPVEMRATPTFLKGGGGYRVGDMVSTGFTSSSSTSSVGGYHNKKVAHIRLDGFSGLTPYRSYAYEPDNTYTGYLKFDAEL